MDREQKERDYRMYVTDALYVLSRGGLEIRWADADRGYASVEPEPPPAEEITSHMLTLINEGRDPVNESI